MKNISLAELRLQAKRRADQESTQFVSDAEWDVYINRGCDKLHNMLVNLYGQDYFVMELEIPVTSIVDDKFPLPSNFFKLLGLDRKESSDYNTIVYKYRWSDRDVYQSAFSSYLNNNRYRLIGNNLSILQPDDTASSYLMYYIPTQTPLVNDTDMFDGLSGFDDYIVVDAARKAALKEESFELAQFLQNELLQLEAMIKAQARNRDVSMPERIQRTRNKNRYNYPFLANSGDINGGI